MLDKGIHCACDDFVVQHRTIERAQCRTRRRLHHRDLRPRSGELRDRLHRFRLQALRVEHDCCDAAVGGVIGIGFGRQLRTPRLGSASLPENAGR